MNLRVVETSGDNKLSDYQSIKIRFEGVILDYADEISIKYRHKLGIQICFYGNPELTSYFSRFSTLRHRMRVTCCNLEELRTKNIFKHATVREKFTARGWTHSAYTHRKKYLKTGLQSKRDQFSRLQIIGAIFLETSETILNSCDVLHSGGSVYNTANTTT
jgi:hypothetical protein